MGVVSKTIYITGFFAFVVACIGYMSGSLNEHDAIMLVCVSIGLMVIANTTATIYKCKSN